MKYFAKITQDYWASKNRTYDQAREVARSMDRKLLDSEHDRSHYILEFNSKIDQLNKNNPRCKDLQVTVRGEHYGMINAEQDCYLYISGIVHITIYYVNQ